MNSPEKGKTVNPLDLFGVAAGLSVELLKGQPDPLAVRAIELTTQRSLEDLVADPEALAGAVATAKGKYFELLVEERLNAGYQIEDLTISGKETASLADSMNQPGWDLKFTDANGKVVDTIQLKATDSVDYIRDTLERYPDIQIVATSEVAGRDQFGTMVLDSGISNAEVTATVEKAIGATSDSVAETFLDNFNPLIPLALIAATEGYRLVVGGQSASLCIDSVVERAKNGLTGTAVGAAAIALGLGPFSIIPAIWAAHAGPGRVFGSIEDALNYLSNNWEKLPFVAGILTGLSEEVRAKYEAAHIKRRAEVKAQILANLRK